MKNKIYAISLLLSFLVVLSHQVISHHHHHDTMAYDFITSCVEADGNKHEHNDKHHHHHNSHEENSNKKDTDKDHNHPFPLHQHVSATNDFDCTRANIQGANTSNQSAKIIVGLHLLHKQYYELPSLNNYNFGEPPFLINSFYKPGAIALRGPPSIV